MLRLTPVWNSRIGTWIRPRHACLERTILRGVDERVDGAVDERQNNGEVVEPRLKVYLMSVAAWSWSRENCDLNLDPGLDLCGPGRDVEM